MKKENGNGKVGAVLVVGGGIGGIQAALDLAESGYYVYLVEKSPSIGGVMAQLDKTFPTNDCSMCILSPKLVEAGRHLNIQLITNAELEEVSGQEGCFKVKILQRPRYIDVSKCTGCGLCAQSDVSNLKEREEEIWVDRILIDEAKCVQCGECALACREENKENHAMTNVSLERRKLTELLPEQQEGKGRETLSQRVSLMDEESRKKFWQAELSRCIKCFGCRDVCPVWIYDGSELDDAEWIKPGEIPPSVPLFQVIRAYRVANLCVNCGMCEEACGMDIPLRTIHQLMWRQSPESIFEVIPGIDEKTKRRLIKRVKERPLIRPELRK